ncbi:BGTF surface domain-containing protein [Halorubrum yunnanense]|uniref:BGTF surface domain-containing protein n=1 Tax=Halorubrum yunnanense TaxID=1526162 RepID=A0ABD5YC91_9EURY|nr:BGTF surface domain-containing protein [Halorubrum yunnanense]
MTATPDDETDRSERSRAAKPCDTAGPKGTDVTLPACLRRLSTTLCGTTALVVLVAVIVVVATAPAAADLSAPDPESPTEPFGPNAVTAEPTAGDGPSDRPAINGSFVRPTYTGIAGDTVEIRYNDIDEKRYLLIGGNRLTDTGGSVGYTDVVVLQSDSNNVTINTRLLGTDNSTAESCREGGCDLDFRDEDGNPHDNVEDLSDLSGATGAGGLARPLVPERYRLAITNGTFVVEEPGVVTPVETAAQSDLLLTKPTFHDEIEVFTTADSNDIEGGADNKSLSTLEQNGLDRTAVTKGDRVVLGFESTGIWGALSYFADKESLQAGQAVDHTVLTKLIDDKQEGVSLRVRQTNPEMNEPRSKLDLSEADPEDVSLFIAGAEELETGDSTPGRLYLVLDTSDGGPFTEDPEPGDEFSVEFALEGTEGQRYAFADTDEPPAAFEPRSDAPEQFPYWETADGTVSAEASFSIQERYFEYDHVTEDGELLVEASGGAVTGTTTILPPIEMSATFVDDKRDEPFRSESQVELSEGNFSISADLGGADPGTRLNYELYDGTTLRDSRTVIVVDDTDDPDRLAIDGVPQNATVAEGGNLSALGIDVRNAGGLEGEGTLALDVADGNLTTARELTLSSNESRTVSFPSATVRLDPGEYPFTTTLDGDQRNGTLVVAENPARTTIDDDDGGADTNDAENSSSSGDDDANSTATDANSTDAGGNSTATDSADATNSDGNTSNPNGNSSDPTGDSGGRDSEDEPTTFLPFGIGTRETLIGTALVGAVHLLGHWV